LRGSRSRLLEPGEDALLRLRADAGSGSQAPCARRLAKLIRRLRAERARDLDRPLRLQAEQAAEADELRLDLALQLVELCDRPGLDELLQPRRDARADAAQLLGPARAHELLDRRLRLADGLGRPAVGARGVEARAGEVEQTGKRLQALGDRRVVHASYMPIAWYPAST
jgi:hypothetical protein